ncbi:MAG TPA: hypothetical protein VGP36_13405 [Mycobacteriales bacterium]|nr:hypothetical protein [Mycobacteriales bacterium]
MLDNAVVAPDGIVYSARRTTSGRAAMTPLKIEFEHHGRTYQVESQSITMWNVHRVAEMNGSMTLETDLLTGDRLFVTWGQVGVLRLLSKVNDKGFAID